MIWIRLQIFDKKYYEKFLLGDEEIICIGLNFEISSDVAEVTAEVGKVKRPGGLVCSELR